MQNFMKLYMRNVLDPKAPTFGLKTSLGQPGPKGRIMPCVWKPGSSFQKHDLSETFLRNHNMNPIKS